MTGPYVGVQINQLPLATNLTGVEPLAIVQSGQTRQVSTALVAAGPSLGGTVQQISTGVGLSGGSGGITVSGKIEVAISGITTSLIANNAVTFAKMQTGSASILIGNPTTSSAIFSAITLGSGLAFSGTTIINTSGTAAGGNGTVTSVALTMPNIFTVAGSPITGAGTLAVTLSNESANLIFAGPNSGAAATPTFRALVGADLPFPTTALIGGVQAISTAASKWINSISQSGVPNLTQPAFADISGTISTAQIPALAYVTQISTGTGLTGGPITGSGTILFSTIAPSALWANVSTATNTPVVTTLGAGLAFSGTTIINTSGAADGVISIIFQSGLSGGTITNTGTVGISNNGVTDAMIRQGSGLSVMGRSATSAGNIADIIGTDQQVFRISGTAGFGAINIASATAVTGQLISGSFPILSGDITTTGGSLNTTLKNTGTSGTYTKVTTDSQGRVSVGATASISDLSVPTGDVSWGTHKIINVTDPTNPQDGATKNYVDNATAGLTSHASCRVATTATLVATYSNGASGVGATLTYVSIGVDTIDGVTLALNDRILVKNQSTTFQNGIYTITTLGTGIIAGILTRATDFDQTSDGEVAEGAYTIIEEGTANAGTLWIETGQGPFTIGTTPIVFTELTVANQTVVLTGDITGTGAGTIATTISSNAVTTSKINNAAVTYAKIQNEAATTLLGNPTGSSAAPSEITLAGSLTFSGTTLTTTNLTAGTVTLVGTGTGLTGGNITNTGTISFASIAPSSLWANVSTATTVPVITTLGAGLAFSGTTIINTSGTAGAGTVTQISTGTGLTGGPITGSGTLSFASIAPSSLWSNVSTATNVPVVTTLGTGLGFSGTTIVATQNYTSGAVLAGSGTATPRATGVNIDVNNSMYGFYGNINAQTVTSYSMSSVDAGKTVSLSNAASITVTCINSLSAGFNALCLQGAAGVVTFTAAAGATLVNRQSALKTAGQYAMVSLYIATNSTGTGAVWILGGDTST